MSLSDHCRAASRLPFAAVLERRLARRGLLKGVASLGAGLAAVQAFGRGSSSAFAFQGIRRGVDTRHHVAPGHEARVLIRWGDPVVPGAPPFDPLRPTPDAQEGQFGYNNDYLGLVPLSPDRTLLCVNHEYTIPRMMFPDGLTDDALRADIEMAAHGLSVVELARAGHGWSLVPGSRYNRRLTGRSGRFALSGPAAGHARLATRADPDAALVIGTLNNCAGGVTPWGSYLSAEENVDGYFHWDGVEAPRGEEASFFHFGIGRAAYGWHKVHHRFAVAHEPLECNRFGWVVELDPKDPASLPRKRTALGRFKHEGAETVLARDGRVIIYMGDDERFECVYRFITTRPFDPARQEANRDLLDDGVLSVARFNADGSLDWLPLVHGEGPLTAANGFFSQADVLIETRRAAALVGGTPMDRPEDVQPDPASGRTYVMLTNNNQRTPAQVDAANPRAANRSGHILVMTAPDGDHGAPRHAWDMLLRCGDPADPDSGALFHPGTGADGWFASPDNAALDPAGRLWVATDQGRAWADTGSADGLYAVETDGSRRGLSRLFFRCPVGAELCGPQFDPEGRTLFLSIQHPGADVPPGGTAGVDAAFAGPSTFAAPVTRWPDFQPGMPPRPSVVMVTRHDGGPIGG